LKGTIENCSSKKKKKKKKKKTKGGTPAKPRVGVSPKTKNPHNQQPEKKDKEGGAQKLG